jgi:two-component sensor histidine kinase
MMQFASERMVPDEQMLLHELNHRVNNEFAAAISVVSLAATKSGNQEVKTALTTVTELLHHYANVHHALQTPEHGDTVLDAEAYLCRLCLSISRSYLDNKNIKLVLAIEPLLLPADASWRLGMIVYELIINGARHAFGSRGGEIHVAVWRDARFVNCSVQDNGSSVTKSQPGRGLKIVDALSNSLGGRFKQTLGPHGSSSLLAFPSTANNRRRWRPKINRRPFAEDDGGQQATAADASAMYR